MYKHAKSTLLLVLLFLGMQLSAQEIDLERELIARYLFNANANNEVENAHHGQPQNISYEADRFGNAASCIWLNGINALITIAHTEELNWDARTESYSIIFWVKATDPLNGSNEGRRILTKWNEIYQTHPYPFSFQVGPNSIANGIRVVGEPAAVYLSINNVFDGNWHMIACTWDHINQTLAIYHNGKFSSQQSNTFYRNTSNDLDIHIGFMPTLFRYFKGYFDDLYFYDRVVNACEIEALYSGQLTEER